MCVCYLIRSAGTNAPGFARNPLNEIINNNNNNNGKNVRVILFSKRLQICRIRIIGMNKRSSRPVYLSNLIYLNNKYTIFAVASHVSFLVIHSVTVVAVGQHSSFFSRILFVCVFVCFSASRRTPIMHSLNHKAMVVLAHVYGCVSVGEKRMMINGLLVFENQR